MIYKITATLIKPGGVPASWVRYTRKKMTRFQCEKLFNSKGAIAGKVAPEKVCIENFLCEPIVACQVKEGMMVYDE